MGGRAKLETDVSEIKDRIPYTTRLFTAEFSPRLERRADRQSPDRPVRPERWTSVPADQLKSMLVLYTGEMVAWPVRQHVGNIKNNDGLHASSSSPDRTLHNGAARRHA
jgi:hypothetical protein